MRLAQNAVLSETEEKIAVSGKMSDISRGIVLLRGSFREYP